VSINSNGVSSNDLGGIAGAEVNIEVGYGRCFVS
jgi:hypothetical protein